MLRHPQKPGRGWSGALSHGRGKASGCQDQWPRAKQHQDLRVRIATRPSEHRVHSPIAAQSGKIGIDRWSNELALKYGMRDGPDLCRRWALGRRILVAQGAVEPPDSTGTNCHLCSRQLRGATTRTTRWAGCRPDRITVILDSAGKSRAADGVKGTGSADIAKAMGIGVETIRSHLKKAQVKLGAHNRSHAACEALRLHLIP